MPRNLYCNVLESSPNVQNLVSKYLQNIANVWFQKSRVSSRSRNVQVSVSSRVFAQILGLEDFGRDSSSDNIPQTPHCKFIKFDIVKFYPSITESLLLKALEFSRTYTDIDDDATSIILQCRKSVLFDIKGMWIKKMMTYSA